MNLRMIQDRLWVKLSCVPRPFFEVGPYLSLSFLAGAFPPIRQVADGRYADFCFGVLAGISIIPVILPRGRATGWPGWVKAWGLGLFLASFALDGSTGFMAGFRDAWRHTWTPELPEPDPWQHFLLLLSVSLVLGYAFYRMAAHRQEADRQRELAAQASQAALRAKLAPHFIFNTLNTLHAQIEADPQGAQATTERLAQLFRQVVDVAERPVIPLKQELAFVEAYLGIEQARLGERLRVEVDVPEELESAEIPPLSLQVLVENAVKHGVAPLERGGEIRIGAERREGTLQLWVEDPGTGISVRKGTGTALETLRQRLAKPEDLTLGMVGGRNRATLQWRQA
jgi:signal transduction histidine kinase